ncbi:AsnC family transcriptional regulator [Aquabacterium sp.]|uniref:siroheme decarboxylase subunit beta n=1 Tax=Aquabacterium sp. TaxID=1872578 RepID=UPI0035B3E47B
MSLTDFDRRLIQSTQGGLPLVARPYAAIAEQLGVTESTVRERMAGMLDAGLIRRIGAVPNHYRLGYTANGMTVWDVDDELVDELGAKVGAMPAVSHCYKRPRALPDWPYNLFAMVHGHSQAEVEREAMKIHCLLAQACRSFDILYSTAILKKTGLRLSHD